MRNKRQDTHGTRRTKEAVNEHGLTDLQEQFCHAYLLKFNITHAERELTLPKGTGHKWMKDEKIRKRINQIRIDTGKAFDVTRENILRQLMNIIHADMRKVKTNYDIVKWPDEEMDAIAEIEYNLLGGVDKVKRWDKLRAIEIVNKMLGYNMPDVTKNLNVNTEPLNKDEAMEIAKMLNEAV